MGERTREALALAAMRIWILYAKAGAGHKMAAEAVRDAIQSMAPSCEVACLDILAQCRYPFRELYPLVYRMLVTRFTRIWGLFFWLTHALAPLRFFRWLRHVFNAFQSEAFTREFLKNPPDYVIATHFFPVEVVGFLKEGARYTGRLAGVVTDLGVHRFWIHPAVDVYFAGIEGTRRAIMREGISSGRIQVTGIPVRRGFVPREREGNGGLKILVAGGGMGVGPVEGLVEILLTYANGIKQVDVVCGDNRALEHKLKLKTARFGTPSIRIHGFVERMHELFLGADLIITKPGGVTVSECLATATPCIFTRPIPGQEEMNLSWLKEQGLAWAIDRPEDARTILEQILADPSLLKEKRMKLKRDGRPFAAQAIALKILEGFH